MTLLRYIKEIVIPACGVHPLYGRVVELGFLDHGMSDAFSSLNIPDIDIQAGFMMPFKPGNEERWNYYHNVMKYILYRYYQKKYNKNYSSQIEFLEKLIDQKDLDFVNNNIEGFWNG